jgi:hypothetical protein
VLASLADRPAGVLDQLPDAYAGLRDYSSQNRKETTRSRRAPVQWPLRCTVAVAFGASTSRYEHAQ